MNVLRGLFFLLGACMALGLPATAISADVLTIGNYQVVSVERVGRTVYEYVLRADISNSDSLGYSQVSANLTSLSPYTVVVDGALGFPDLDPNGSATSGDTFTVRHNRRQAFSTANFDWTVNAIPVGMEIACFGFAASDPAVCSGVGSCYESDLTGEPACKCPPDRLGADCWYQTTNECFGTPADNPYVCNGHGQCIDQDTCLCEAGWHGSLCHKTNGVACDGIPNNNPAACSGNGVCVENGTCDCFDNFTGANCETELQPLLCPGIAPGDIRSADDPNVCGGVGECVYDHTDAQGQQIGVCDCLPHYSGAECHVHGWFCISLDMVTDFHDPDPPGPGGCANGTCTHQDHCECEPGWIGDMCEVAPDSWCGILHASDPAVCSGRGLCKDMLCFCAHANYYGSECQFVRECNGIDAFSKNVCSGHGLCQQGSFVDQGVCLCDPGYSGSDCEIKL